MNNLPEEIFENCVLPDDKLQGLPSSAGFVLFADSTDKPIVLLTTSNIKRTAKTKLAEKIEPTKRADLKSITAKIYYTVCPCKFRLAIKYFDAVRKIFGQNYKEHIKLVLPWFIKIDLSEKIPFFSVTKKPTFKTGEEIFGPFPGQRAATVFLKAIEDAFKLCKRSDLVNNGQAAQSCPYLQMDACVGVCGGKISDEDYRSLLKDAFEAAVRPMEAIERLKTEMQTAAKELDFEKATGLKKKIEKLSALKKQSYKWTSDLKKLKIVHIDKSKKIKPEGSKTKKQTYAVFVMDFFNIIDAGDFGLDNPDLIYEAISKNLNNLSRNISDEIIERFSIASYFLYRSKSSGLWINASEGFNREEILKFKI
jgi:excinuclease UvrABC nuclease subunit